MGEDISTHFLVMNKENKGNNSFFSDLLFFPICYSIKCRCAKNSTNTEQHDKNTNEAPGNIPVINNIFDILKSPFGENENGGL